MTNGELFVKTYKPYKVLEYTKFDAIHVYITEADFNLADNQIVFSGKWWNSEYKNQDEN